MKTLLPIVALLLCISIISCAPLKETNKYGDHEKFKITEIKWSCEKCNAKKLIEHYKDLQQRDRKFPEEVKIDFSVFYNLVDDKDSKTTTVAIGAFNDDQAKVYVDEYNAAHKDKIEEKDLKNKLTFVFITTYNDNSIRYYVPKICPPPPDCGPIVFVR